MAFRMLDAVELVGNVGAAVLLPAEQVVSTSTTQSSSQKSPCSSQILWRTTQVATMLGTFHASVSIGLSKQRHLPFSRPKAFSTTILDLLCR